LAIYDIENILRGRYNEKLKISLGHVKYTQASIWGRICSLEKYLKPDSVIKSLQYYVEALTSGENYDERMALIEKKIEKHIYEDLFNLLRHITDYMKDDIDITQKCSILASDLEFDLASSTLL